MQADTVHNSSSSSATEDLPCWSKQRPCDMYTACLRMANLQSEQQQLLQQRLSALHHASARQPLLLQPSSCAFPLLHSPAFCARLLLQPPSASALPLQPHDEPALLQQRVSVPAEDGSKLSDSSTLYDLSRLIGLTLSLTNHHPRYDTVQQNPLHDCMTSKRAILPYVMRHTDCNALNSHVWFPFWFASGLHKSAQQINARGEPSARHKEVPEDKRLSEYLGSGA